MVVVDNLSTGHKRNLEPLLSSITFYEGDILDAVLLAKAASDVEVVFHEAARRQNCRRVVLASSSAVYGDDPSLPKDEKMPPRPQSPYAVQKLTNEYYAGLYARLYGLETIGLRYFNVFGPRQNPSSPYSGVISLFMDRATHRRQPVIYGDGEQSRDFIYVGDVVRANLLAATTEAAVGQVFNVGREEAISINTLWQRVADLAGIELAPDYTAPRAGDIRHSLASIAQARKTLALEPQIQLTDGLQKTYQSYRAQSGNHQTRQERSP